MTAAARIRFRTDASHVAEAKALGRDYHPAFGTREEWDATPAAAPGDCWRVTWYGTGAVAGYRIGCPTCGGVHSWTLASNCASRQPGKRCEHEGTGSCWTWTGSAEAGTLTASPSLWWPRERGGCGFHGWLTDGELRSI